MFEANMSEFCHHQVRDILFLMLKVFMNSEWKVHVNVFRKREYWKLQDIFLKKIKYMDMIKDDMWKCLKKEGAHGGCCASGGKIMGRVRLEGQ